MNMSGGNDWQNHQGLWRGHQLVKRCSCTRQAYRATLGGRRILAQLVDSDFANLVRATEAHEGKNAKARQGAQEERMNGSVVFSLCFF